MNDLVSAQLEELKIRKKPFPLWAFLEIYRKANHECYINYMEGAEILVEWLTNDREIPLEFTPVLDIPPRLLAPSYEIQELARCIVGDLTATKLPDNLWRRYKKVVEDAIIVNEIHRYSHDFPRQT